MPSITSWTRLEPSTRSEDINIGLQACVADPLWMLARQWQVGEFQGEDNGSPVKVELKIELSQLKRYFPGYPDNNSATSSLEYDSRTLPLETLVEREPVPSSGETNLRLAAEAGLHFFRILGHDLTTKYRVNFLKNYTLTQSAQKFDRDSIRFKDIMVGRVFDGVVLRSKFSLKRKVGEIADLPKEPPFDGIDPKDSTTVKEAITAWLDWFDTFYSQPEGNLPWKPEWMEYEFAVSAPITPSETYPSKELVLVASEYTGEVEWYSFNVDSKGKLGAEGEITEKVITAIPTPVRFRGMPASRYWEFEFADINFGNVKTNREDLAQLLLIEFALIYSNDLFIIPLELDIGSICRIQSMMVTDTFGVRTTIKPFADEEGESAWRMFRLSPEHHSETGIQSKTSDLFFLPPALGASLQSKPVEEVLLLRDEMANMAWGVERVIESPIGRPLNRFEAYQEERRLQEPKETTSKQPSLKYHLANLPPPYWIPLLRKKMEDNSTRFKRGALLRVKPDGTQEEIGPEGRILERDRDDLNLYEEVVPQSGVSVARVYQYARWMDGLTYLWKGRSKQPSDQKEKSSGLRFDSVEAQ